MTVFTVWHTSPKRSTIWETFECGAMKSGRTSRARTALAKFFTLLAQAIAGFSSCGEVACYPQILGISYILYKITTFVLNNL